MFNFSGTVLEEELEAEKQKIMVGTIIQLLN
jgi:hypothetical protein